MQIKKGEKKAHGESFFESQEEHTWEKKEKGKKV